ncbi:uncharacterized protein RHO17_005973 [Thomomys bottae]
MKAQQLHFRFSADCLERRISQTFLRCLTSAWDPQMSASPVAGMTGAACLAPAPAPRPPSPWQRRDAQQQVLGTRCVPSPGQSGARQEAGAGNRGPDSALHLAFAGSSFPSAPACNPREARLGPEDPGRKLGKSTGA